MGAPSASLDTAGRYLVVHLRGRRCGIPLDAIGSLAQGSRVEDPDSLGRRRIAWRRWHLPVVDVREVPRHDVSRSPVLLLKKGLVPCAIVVDAVEGLRPLVVPAQAQLPPWARGTIFGAIARDRGEPLLLVDLDALGRDVSAATRGHAQRSNADEVAPVLAAHGVHLDRSQTVEPVHGHAAERARSIPARTVLLGRLRCPDSLHTVALDAARVAQVLPLPKLPRVAGSRPELLGLYAWRHTSVPVLDVASVGGTPEADGPSRRLLLCYAGARDATSSQPAMQSSRDDAPLVGLPLDEALRLAPVPAGTPFGPPGVAPWPRIALGRFAFAAELVHFLDLDAIASILYGMLPT